MGDYFTTQLQAASQLCEEVIKQTAPWIGLYQWLT